MKNYLLIFAILAVATFSSCGEEETPPPPHEVGEWNLKNYAFLNLPSGFKNNEGRSFELNELNLGIESYKLVLQVNKNFEREIIRSGTLPQEHIGTYTISEDELILTSTDFDNGDEIVYGVERNRNNRLWLSQPQQTVMFEDAVLDTLTQEYINSLSEQEYKEFLDTYLKQVSLDLVFAFEKEEVQ